MTAPFAIQFGKIVRKLREDRGWAQDELAHRAGLHRSQVTLIETGARIVRLPTIEKLAKGLHIQPSALMPEIHLPAKQKSKPVKSKRK